MDEVIQPTLNHHAPQFVPNNTHTKPTKATPEQELNIQGGKLNLQGGAVYKMILKPHLHQHLRKQNITT